MLFDTPEHPPSLRWPRPRRAELPGLAHLRRASSLLQLPAWHKIKAHERLNQPLRQAAPLAPLQRPNPACPGGQRLPNPLRQPAKAPRPDPRRATPLLPVAQRAHTDTDHQGEFALRGAEFPSHHLDLRGTEHRCSRRLHPAPPNAACLPHTRDEFPKRCIFHLNSEAERLHGRPLSHTRLNQFCEIKLSLSGRTNITFAAAARTEACHRKRPHHSISGPEGLQDSMAGHACLTAPALNRERRQETPRSATTRRRAARRLQRPVSPVAHAYSGWCCFKGQPQGIAFRD